MFGRADYRQGAFFMLNFNRNLSLNKRFSLYAEYGKPLPLCRSALFHPIKKKMQFFPEIYIIQIGTMR